MTDMLQSFDPASRELIWEGPVARPADCDRAIAAAGASRPLLIGVAHAFQQVRSVPVEAWDMPLDAVVTEERIHEFRAGCLS